MKKILIINGHPNPSSFNFGIAESYLKGAIASGSEVDTITIANLKFNPNLQFGYQKRTELEPDLIESWQKIKKADHLVWIHPIWWGGLPAITKGFIDRLFLPGMAFEHRENSVWWDKLLKGKTAHIITTLDQPSWYYKLVYGNPSVNQLKKTVLEFCGVKPVKVSYIGIIKTSDDFQKEKWLQKVYDFGLKNK
ncbi:putative NADPH-quinone reductase [Flavobacterium sp. 90]|uniref:NAD(P)H-dependent oxidoreductase n=1 Tax=unclassified Flavobacterium TaxID=196869 RepID=UPI000EAF0562|nr:MULTISPECIES: NAD(P)H-dependent oxidoreductase [unclassified Flavobacterium]RKR11973.1 putative NADPH-quinone reductase [Flavobacterium sp. 81]TCK55746.1 putative NADPH-quinone reductase [Flavobacterium sp. 90]